MGQHPTPGPYATEVVGMWYGVEIPGWLRAFDCRAALGEECNAVGPDGTTLYGSERAAWDCGLRVIDGSCRSERFDTSPTSCQTYIDARTAPVEELRKQVSDMVREATKLRDEYLRMASKPATDGGGCYYMPVLIEMSNFGWSVVSDRRTCVVRSYQG